MAKGFDYPGDCRPFIPQIKAAGLDFVERYMGAGSDWKRLTRPEAMALQAAGIGIVSVCEAWAAETSSDVARFTEESGAAMANQAWHDAVLLGQPAGSAIYFAVDGDVSQAQIDRNIMPFFKGIFGKFAALSGENAGYRIGVYGSGLVGHNLLSAGAAELFQIANARGWRGYDEHKSLACLIQGETGDPYGFGRGRQIDVDEGIGDYGGWNAAGAPRPTPAPTPAPVPSTKPTRVEVVATIMTLQKQLSALGYYASAIDGDPGPMTLDALTRFRRGS